MRTICIAFRHGLLALCLLAIFCPALPGGLWAQTTPARFTQTLKGQVVDQESQQPVIGANILILDTDPPLGASTDENGRFRIENVPVGRYNLRITCIGYEDATLQEVTIGAGKEADLNIRLSEALIQMEEVVVKAQKAQGSPINEMASISARSFSVEQTKRYAAAINDPARMAMSFAGVATNDDGNNQIIIRGNSPKSLLWRMEGIEIPNPNHFGSEGASGGGVSALSVNVLSNSDFFTSAFPAEYGNATSGVFDLRLRRGNNEKREYAIQAGFLGLDVAAEGPIGKPGGASYLANYRYSTLALLGKMNVFPEESGVPEYQDAAFKVFVPMPNNNYLSLWGMGGLSRQRFDDTTARLDFRSDRAVMGLNYRHYTNENTYLEAILSYAANRIVDDYADKTEILANDDEYVNEAIRASLLYNRKIDARHTLRAGFIGSRLMYNLSSTFTDSAGIDPRVNQQGHTHFLQAYAQWKYRARPNLTLNAGFHGSLLALNGAYAIEPRLGLRWNIAPGQALSAGFGLHSRPESMSVYFAQVQTADQTVQPNLDLDLNRAAHIVLGYERRLADNWRLQAEVYYQHLYNLPIAPAGVADSSLLYLSPINRIDGFLADSLVSEGTGRNYGIELTVERFFNGGFYLLATTSLYRSLYTPRQGRELSTRFDGRYVQNILVGKEWKVGHNRANAFGANIRALWAGGNRHTPINLDASQAAGEAVYNWSRTHAEQLPHYFRFDFRVSYSKNRRNTTSTISLDIQNVTNRRNVYGRFYDAKSAAEETYYQLGLTPVLNYRLEF